METYFHINKEKSCNWKVGDEIEFESQNNHYWRSLAEEGDFIELSGEKYPANLVTEKAFKAYAKIELAPPEMKEYHFNILRTLNEALDSLGNSIRINRELIFEDIRKEYYPNLPSRQKGVWLIPNDEKSLEFWKSILRSDNKRIFKVGVEGNIHRSPQKWLEPGTFPVNKLSMQAHKYWKGEESGNYDDEILLEGKITILEEITKGLPKISEK
jgi:hypothetical protein